MRYEQAAARRRIGLVVAAGIAGLPLLLATPAAGSGPGHGGERRFDGDLRAVPHPTGVAAGAAGEVELRVRGVRLSVELEAEGLSPNLPHVAHIHGVLQAENECPAASADTDGNGLISVVEGLPFYGPIQVSFTTRGGVSGTGDDPFAIEDGVPLVRAPRADADGELSYERTFTLPAPVPSGTRRDLARALGGLHVVVHGVDRNGNGRYDPDNPNGGDPSDVEAALPALCGALDPD